jgi:hypothetical protein
MTNLEENGMKTIVGLFDNRAQADKAMTDLESAGIPHADISFVANNANGQYGVNPDADPSVSTDRMAAAATTDAEIGGVLGLLAGASLFVIPGLGWLAGAGWLGGLIGGAVTGGIVGGLVGALTHVGVPHEDATYYNEGVRRGGILLAVKADDAVAERTAQILSDDGAVDINERATQWRNEGFVPTPPVTTAQPFTASTATTGYAEPLGAHTGRGLGYDAYASDFRNDYQTRYGTSGVAYEQVEPAYRYGYDMANDPRYRGRDWNAVQNDLQRDWETRQPGTWSRFSNSVRYAWDRATGAEVGGIQTGGHAIDGTPDTRGVTEKIADAVTGDRIDDKTGKVV